MKATGDRTGQVKNYIEDLTRSLGMSAGPVGKEHSAETLKKWEGQCLEEAATALQIQQTARDFPSGQIGRNRFKAAMHTLKLVRTAMRRK